MSAQANNGLSFGPDNGLYAPASTPGTGGKAYARFVVGTSMAGWTGEMVDYLCDGVDDQVEIQAAIDALPEGGGEVVLLDGVYNISARISINSGGVCLVGNGYGTILNCNSDWIISLYANECVITDFKMTGGMEQDGTTIAAYINGNNNRLSNLFVEQFNTRLVFGITGNYNVVEDCRIMADSVRETCLYTETTGSTAVGNLFVGNVVTNFPSSSIGINPGCEYTVICNNIFQGLNNNPSGYTLYIAGDNSLVLGNLIPGKNYTDLGSNNTFANNKYQ